MEKPHCGETTQHAPTQTPCNQPACRSCAHVVIMCYTKKASPTRHRPERQHNARSNRRKQCSPNETKPYFKPTLPRKRQTTPTNGHTPRRWKPTHTRLTYTRMRPHAPSHQAGDHLVPAHTERHNPPRLRTQRQSGLPPCHACVDKLHSALVWLCVTRGKLHRPGTAKEGRNTPTQRTATVDLNDSQPAPLTDQAPDTMAPPHTHPRVKL